MASKSEKRSWKKKGEFIYNPDSNLIIKSAKEKVVIGRFDEDGNKVEDEKTLELCKEYGLDPDTSLLEAVAEKEEKEEEDENEEEKEDEEKEEDEKEEEEDEEKEDPPKRNDLPKKEKESVQKESSQKESSQKESSQNKNLSSLLETFTKQVESIVNGHVQRNRELEEQLNTTRKELEETKKKLKKILSDMMDKL